MMEVPVLSLVDVSTSQGRLTVDGNTYNVRRLVNKDFADAQQHLRDRAMTSVLEKLRSVPVDDGVVSDAMARVATKRITLLDILEDCAGEQFLLTRMFGPVPPLPRAILLSLMLWGCGLKATEEVLGPLDGRNSPGSTATAPTSTATERTGDAPSATCATGTS